MDPEPLLSPDVLLQQMAGAGEQPARDHAAVLKGVRFYFWNSEPWQIDTMFVLQFAFYFNALYNRMIERGVSSVICNAVLVVLAKVNNQCGKIRTGKIDDDYYRDFKLVALALPEISDQLEQFGGMQI